MSRAISKSQPVSFIADFKEVTKMRLSVSVVFSAIAGYFLGALVIDFVTVLLLAVGGYLMVGASNVFNQIWERKLDAKMDRTKNRPLAARRMSIHTALIIGITFTVFGIGILYLINPKTALYGALSIAIYVLAYTPLKTRTPLSVFVGAIPGAIPFMMGWIAATNHFGIEAGTLFMIQFFWQFPHFWALGWWLYDDYKKGGFFMLPTRKKDSVAATQTILYSFWTLAISVIPVFGITGRLKISWISGVLVFLLGCGLIYYAFRLYRIKTKKAARELMFASVSYITLLQIIYVLDKYITLWI